MLLGAISFMAVKTIKRKPFVQSAHFGISRGFCQNRSGRNLRHQAIASDYGGYRIFQSRTVRSIHEHPARLERQAFDSTLHCEQAGLENVQAIDFPDGCDTDCPSKRMSLDGNG